MKSPIFENKSSHLGIREKKRSYVFKNRTVLIFKKMEESLTENTVAKTTKT